MIRFFKELYLTGFTLSFRFRMPERFGGGWEPTVDAVKGVTGVAAIEIVIFTMIMMWIEIYFGARFFSNAGKLIFVLSIMPIYFVNYYALLTRGHGIKFKREHDTLEKSRRLLLRSGISFMYLASVFASSTWVGGKAAVHFSGICSSFARTCFNLSLSS